VAAPPNGSTADYARVVFEDADAPSGVYFFCGFGDVSFEEAINFSAVDANFALEGFVVAVFAPGLPDGLKFHVSGVPLLRCEVGLDLFHFLQA
jgi:hypothetical protein